MPGITRILDCRRNGTRQANLFIAHAKGNPVRSIKTNENRDKTRCFSQFSGAGVQSYGLAEFSGCLAHQVRIDGVDFESVPD